MDGNLVLGVVAAIAFLVIITVIVNRLNSRKIKRANLRYVQKKEESRKQIADFSDDTSDRVELLAEIVSADPDKILLSNKAFEHAVEKLKKSSPQDPMLKSIPSLREDLGYTFFNRRASFICTQMLQPGQKLRVIVKYKGKGHSYVSSIINTNEDVFWVAPPTVKGNAVDLSKFKQFGFRVFRKNDGEYRFSCRLKSQIKTPANALVMEHSRKIKKIHTREHDRYKLQFKRQFHVSDGETSLTLNGVVMDISIGGLKFHVKEIPEQVKEGVNVFFKFEEAGIKPEIKAKIVRIVEGTQHTSVHLQFEDMSELNRLHLQKFVASKNPIKVK